MRARDASQKEKMKEYADQRRRATPCDINPGDAVLVRQPKQNKLTTPYDSVPYTVTERKGTMVTARRNDKEITRNSSHFKRIDESHMTRAGSGYEDESDDEITYKPVAPPMPPDRPQTGTVPPTTPPRNTAVGNPPTPQTPLRRQSVPRAIPCSPPTVPSSSPRAVPRSLPTVPSSSPARMRPRRAQKAPTWMKDYVKK